jgi:uncharacterized protein YbcI
MVATNSAMAERVARAAIAGERRRTGHAPQAVNVVLGGDTLVITLHGVLSPAERVLAKSPAGAAEVQEFHRQLFNNASEELRQDVERITGVGVREAASEVETTTGTVVKVFTTDTMVQVFLLAKHVPAGSCHTTGPGESS